MSPSCRDMVSSADRLAGAAAVGSAGVAAVSRSCVRGPGSEQAHGFTLEEQVALARLYSASAALHRSLAAKRR